MTTISSWLIRLVLTWTIAGAGLLYGNVSGSNGSPEPQKSTQSVPVKQDSPGTTAPVLVSPKSGTRIEWQVVGAGGTKSNVGDLTIEGTAGQTAIGQVGTPNFIINQGFWQEFELPCRVGDVDNDGGVDISDAVYLIQYIFAGGPAPANLCAGDVTGDTIVDISDVIAILSFVFLG